ncbi:MAG: ComF family protein [Pseudomonadales bacterium]
MLYSLPAARLVNGLKHQARICNASALAGLLHEAVLRDRRCNRPDDAVAINTGAVMQPAIDLLLPVPLHSQRLRERGYNQALEIAKPLARSLSLPLLREACTRTDASRPQQGLKRRQRVDNLRHAFRCDERVRNKRIAIIDDVMTTGSTADAVARSALCAGAAYCEVWCVARTPSPGAPPQRDAG